MCERDTLLSHGSGNIVSLELVVRAILSSAHPTEMGTTPKGTAAHGQGGPNLSPTSSTAPRQAPASRQADVIELAPASDTSNATPDDEGAAISAAIARTVLHSLDESKAENVTDIDITGKSPLADRMIVASGRSQRHVGAVSDRLLRDLKEAGFGTAKVEGLPAADWVLIDGGDVVIHLFRPEVREFYNLERMWMAERTADA